MKIKYFSFLLIIISFSSYSQKVYSVEYSNQSDVKIYMVVLGSVALTWSN